MAKKRIVNGLPYTESGMPDGWEWQLERDQGEFDPVPAEECETITLAQVSDPGQFADRQQQALALCDEAELWLNGAAHTVRGTSCCIAPPDHSRNVGVAKSAMRDAIVILAECCLGLPGPKALDLVRRWIDDTQLAATGPRAKELDLIRWEGEGGR